MQTVTLAEFIDKTYAPWVTEHRRGGVATVRMLKTYFAGFMAKAISNITVNDIEIWQAFERSRGLKPCSINRPLTALKSALNWALKREIITVYPLKHLEMLREETDYRVRYLSDDERTRLFEAIDEREKKLKQQHPNLSTREFVDYIKPAITVALNTGIRRGSLFAMRWNDVNFSERIITVRAATAKSGKTIYIPMNDTVYRVLHTWKKQTQGENETLVFHSVCGGRIVSPHYLWGKLLKSAGIVNFRWHDMRHDFASRLVMAGVDLNTVRELLGHANLNMTLRYAHLAPKVKQEAVNMLDCSRNNM